jgi:hypothetical protein
MLIGVLGNYMAKLQKLHFYDLQIAMVISILMHTEQ